MPKFALIKDGSITNVIVADYSSAQATAKSSGSDNFVLVDQYKVQKNDTYDGSNFYRGGVKIPKELTTEEKTRTNGRYATDLDLYTIELGQITTDLDLRLRALEEA